MSGLELKIPPDVVWVVVAGLMWLASRVTTGFGAAESFRRPLALMLMAIGTGLVVAARVALAWRTACLRSTPCAPSAVSWTRPCGR